MATPIAAALSDLANAIRTERSRTERSRTERSRTERSEVWLSIFNAVASCHNADQATATRWADSGLVAYETRFPLK